MSPLWENSRNLKSGAKFGNVLPPELCIELAMPLFQDDDNDRQRLLFSHQYLQPKLNISFCLTFEDKNYLVKDSFGKTYYVIKDKKIHDCKMYVFIRRTSSIEFIRTYALKMYLTHSSVLFTTFTY